MKGLSALLLLIALQGIGSRAFAKATVFAHYSFWYTGGDGSGVGTWPPDESRGKLLYPMPRYPLLDDEGSTAFGTNHGFGGYDTTAASNINRHIAWARQYGIDVFALLWDGKSGGRFSPSVDAFRKAESGMPWIIFYDTNVRFGRLGVCTVSNPLSNTQPCPYDLDQKVRDGDTVKTTGQILVDDFMYMKQAGWIDDPDYFRVNGRPVIWIYQAFQFSDQSASDPKAKRWSSYIADIRKWYWNNYRTEIFLVGNIAGPRRTYDPKWDSYIRQFDAVSGWSPYYLTCPIDPDCGCCRPNAVADAVAPVVQTWVDKVPTMKTSRVSGGKASIEFVPFITPQFDDQWVKGSGRPRMIARSKDDFRYMAQVLGANMLTGRNWVFLSTFNAWPEGTTVEPTCDWKSGDCGPDYSDDRGLYGFDFLEVIRDVFGTD